MNAPECLSNALGQQLPEIGAVGASRIVAEDTIQDESLKGNISYLC